MEKFKNIFGDVYSVYLYSDDKYIGTRNVYYHCGKYYVKYKGKYGEILDFNVNGILLGSVDVNELYFRK